MPPAGGPPGDALEDLPAEIGDDEQHWTAYVFAVWNLIIRPPRHRYSRLELMADFPYENFRLHGQPARRRHFHITNQRGDSLACTVFEPTPEPGASSHPSRAGAGAEATEQRACVVHCHGNGACRLAGFRLVPLLLPLGIGVCCFDFAGSGMSGGEYVSLGHFEKDDLSVVIDHLRTQLGFSHIGLWGYSMGAATALMHAARDPTLAGVVADSPFCDLWQLIQEVCGHFLPIPAVVIKPVMHFVRLMIYRKAGFDICDVSPKAHVGGSFVPALMLHGEGDDFVRCDHSEALRREYCGEVQRLTMPKSTHGSPRADTFMARAVVFMVRAFRWEKQIPQGRGELFFGELLVGRIPKVKDVKPGGPDDAQPQLPAALLEALSQSLRSDDPRQMCDGLVRTALALCAPYRGGEMLPCGVPVVGAISTPCASKRADAYRSGPMPARFVGKLTFADRHSEVALCWIRDTGLERRGALEGGCVEFAVISPTVASLTSVVLERRSKDAAAMGRNTPGGLQCSRVVPKDLGELALEVNRAYDIALRVNDAGAELLIDGAPAVSASDGPGGGEFGCAHLWSVHWRQQGVAAPVVELSACVDSKPSPPRSRQTRRPKSIASEDDNTERLAEDLATLCLGPEPLGEAARARLRSGVYVLD